MMALAVCACFHSTQGIAKERATAQARAEAIVVAPLSFFKVDDLDFARFIAGTTSGTIVMSPSGARAATGGVRLAGSAGTPARFAGFGRYNQVVSIAISNTSVRLTRVGGTETMRLDTFVIGSTPEAQLTTSPLAFRIASQSGMFNFPVGATLRVSARQAPGAYRGSFSVTLQYQ
ncbi:DUF4402 domain-containing protein [Novosphingobium sp.]|uniref:DUF4402 domain-containing protein n=1 Tax=Novosphingobium sp. TaxID=1874826 RepID=UPI001ED6F17B|nr:DUF4402 domain-containing protein [Novosphingobium sp.]MBK6801667.1 DUF4402 domain-containing protein [Novosphingobium sp.]MBK9009964.1 DUF4402 domain-containing protein [Novosphingobium sp.]